MIPNAWQNYTIVARSWSYNLVNVGHHGHLREARDGQQDGMRAGEWAWARAAPPGVWRFCAGAGRFAAAWDDGLGGMPGGDDANAVVAAADTRCRQ